MPAAAPTDEQLDQAVRARARCKGYLALAAAVTRGKVAARVPLPGYGRAFVHLPLRQLVGIVNGALPLRSPARLHWPVPADAIAALDHEDPAWAAAAEDDKARDAIVNARLLPMRRAAATLVAQRVLIQQVRPPRGGEFDGLDGDGVTGTPGPGRAVRSALRAPLIGFSSHGPRRLVFVTLAGLATCMTQRWCSTHFMTSAAKPSWSGDRR